MTSKSTTGFQPNRILSYFRIEWKVLLIVIVSGLIYNLGLLAGPWFEGQMIECLVRIHPLLNPAQKQTDAPAQQAGNLDSAVRTGTIGYLGHDPELFNDSIENNILMGTHENADKFLQMVCLDKEVSEIRHFRFHRIPAGNSLAT